MLALRPARPVIAGAGISLRRKLAAALPVADTVPGEPSPGEMLALRPARPVIAGAGISLRRKLAAALPVADTVPGEPSPAELLTW
jgi:hypothetical protein